MWKFGIISSLIQYVSESGRKSGRKIRSDMISRPQNDLRHTGHIGYDGAMFGDVAFIGEAFEKLPNRVSGTKILPV